MYTALTFIGFTLFVAFYSWYKLRKEKLNSKDGYFLGGRSLTGVVIAGSMLLTNISTEHLIPAPHCLVWHYLSPSVSIHSSRLPFL